MKDYRLLTIDYRHKISAAKGRPCLPSPARQDEYATHQRINDYICRVSHSTKYLCKQNCRSNIFGYIHKPFAYFPFMVQIYNLFLSNPKF